MAVVLDLVNNPRPRHPEKAHRPDSPVLRKPDWIRVKAPVSHGLLRHAEHHARERPAHRVRGGRLPEYRRVLGEEARHLHDHGRHLHARLRVLQRQDRAAGRARSRTSRSTSPRRPQSSASPISSSPRSTATISPMAAREHFAETIRAIRARCPQTTIEVLTPDFLRKDGALEQVVAARPDVFNHNLETVPSLYLTVRPGARYFAFAAAAAAGQGNRPDDVHQVRHHGRPRRGAERSAAGDGRPALGRRRFPHHRPISAADPQAPCGRCASCRRTSSRRSKTIAYAKGFLMVSASPLTRSSHHAGEDFARLKAARGALR